MTMVMIWLIRCRVFSMDYFLMMIKDVDKNLETRKP